MRLEIDAGGRKVSIEASDANLSPREVMAELLAAWHETEGATDPSQGPAYGFMQERRDWTTPRHGDQGMVPPRADGVPDAQ